MSELTQQQLFDYLSMQLKDFDEYIYLKSEQIGCDLRTIFSTEALLQAWIHDHGFEEHQK